RVGILAWLVRGALAYNRDPLTPPAEVIAKTQAFFAQFDFLARWLESCERCDAKDGLTINDLWGSFDGWCSRNGVGYDQRLTMRAMSGRLEHLGYRQKRYNTARLWNLRFKQSV